MIYLKNLASKKKSNNKYAFIIYIVITYKMTRIQNVGPQKVSFYFNAFMKFIEDMIIQQFIL